MRQWEPIEERNAQTKRNRPLREINVSGRIALRHLSNAQPRIYVLCGVFLLFLLVSMIFVPQNVAFVYAHTYNPPPELTCAQGSFSSDGNPFSLCPGPYLTGGNCVWWAW